jgi:exosortase/archaeosortase family protein
MQESKASPVKSFGADEKKLILFFVKLALIWVSWKGILYVLIGAPSPMEERIYPPLSMWWEAWNDQLAHFILQQGTSLLQFLGYEAYTTGRNAWIEGSGGIWMGNYCIGIQLMYYYVMLLLVSPIRTPAKLLGMVVGIVVTFLLNITRVAGLCMISLHAPRYMFIAHDHVFNIIVFGTLIGIYYLLSKRQAWDQQEKNQETPPPADASAA